MTSPALPRGRKPLPVIRRLPDSADQVVALVTLIDWLLKVPIGHRTDSSEVKSGEDVEKLGSIISEHIDKFTVDKRDLFFALKVRNSFAHATECEFTPAQIDRAADYLFSGVHDLLDHVDDEVKRLVLHDPYLVSTSLPLSGIERITDPVVRLLGLRDRLNALLALIDERDGRWRYDLSAGEHVITVQHRVQAHLPDLGEVSPERIQSAINLCSEIDALSAEERAKRPLSDYRDAIADLSHVVRSLEPSKPPTETDRVPVAVSQPAPTRAPIRVLPLVVVSVCFIAAIGMWKAGLFRSRGPGQTGVIPSVENAARQRARTCIAETETARGEATRANGQRFAASVFTQADEALARARSALDAGRAESAISEALDATSRFRSARELAARWGHVEAERAGLARELAEMIGRVVDAQDVQWIATIESRGDDVQPADNPEAITTAIHQLRLELHDGYVRRLTARIQESNNDVRRADLAVSILEVAGDDEEARKVFAESTARASGWWLSQAEKHLASIAQATLKSKVMRLFARTQRASNRQPDATASLRGSLQILQNAADVSTLELVEAYQFLALDALAVGACDIAREASSRALALVPTIPDVGGRDSEYDRNLFTATLAGVAKRCGDTALWDAATKQLPVTPPGFAKGQHWAACAAAAAGDFARATSLSDDWRSPVHIAYFAALYGERDVYRAQCAKIADILAGEIGFGSKGWNDWALSIVAQADVYAGDVFLGERRIRELPRAHNATKIAVSLIVAGYARDGRRTDAERLFETNGEKAPNKLQLPETLDAPFELGKAYAREMKPYETLSWLAALATPASKAAAFAGAAAGTADKAAHDGEAGR